MSLHGRIPNPKGEPRRVIVVLGPGRSGTSLLMQVLAALGMEVSADLLPASGANPAAFCEDAEIVALHKEAMKELDFRPGYPLPEGWAATEVAQDYRLRMEELLQRRLAESSGIWGFKDPRTSTFLPLWNRVFSTPGLLPVFLLAVRDPRHTLVSLRSQASRPDKLHELLWLQRVADALDHTAGNCFVAHYEDWFSRPDGLAEELAAYTGLPRYAEGGAARAAKLVIDRALNRSPHRQSPQIGNSYVRHLYRVLKECRGADFQREALMQAVREAHEVMQAFRPWHSAQTQFSGKNRPAVRPLSETCEGRSVMRNGSDPWQEAAPLAEAELCDLLTEGVDQGERLQSQVVRQQRRIAELEEDLQVLVRENSRYLEALQQRHDEVEQCRAQLAEAKTAVQQLQQRSRKLQQQLDKAIAEQAETRPQSRQSKDRATKSPPSRAGAKLNARKAPGPSYPADDELPPRAAGQEASSKSRRGGLKHLLHGLGAGRKAKPSA